MNVRPPGSAEGPRVALLDYRMSNLHSAAKALERLGARVRVVGDDGPVDEDAVVLPGVGHFGEASRRLREQGLDRLARDAVARGIPLLGICLGMQLLFDGSEESPERPGLGLIPGSVRRIRTDRKLPNIGWRTVHWAAAPDRHDAYYFVHTYACHPDDPGVVAGTADHGTSYCAAVSDGLVTGFQFHPEKSSVAGLALLDEWLAGVGAAKARAA